MTLRVQERIVAGDEADGLVVHHLVLRGGNRAIGRHLGEMVCARYGVGARPADDPLRVSVQREWLRRNSPVLYERMCGSAAALGVDLADDAYDVTRLGTPPAAAACSAVFVPPRRTTSGGPLVSRTFDHAGPLARPRRGEPPPASRPYVLEIHPDEGHPSLALCAFDLLGAALDGVNAEGLVVVVASDEESAGLAPAGASVGLDELQIVRHLLESCANAAEAREALLSARLYCAAQPAHWLVADRHGDAFVFSVSEPLPLAPDPVGTDGRWRALAARVAERGPLDADALDAAMASGAPAAGDALRPLWHGVYDPVERSLRARFFTGAGAAATARFQLAA
jgi:hypothetical protein